MNASLQVSRHGADERMRVLGAAHRLDQDDSDFGVVDAMRAYGQPTVEAAIAYRERMAKEKAIRESTGHIKMLLTSMWLRTRTEEVMAYLENVPQKDRPEVNMASAQAAVHQLDADPSPYGIAMAIAIHGKPLVDEIMVLRLHQLHAEALQSGIPVPTGDLYSGLKAQIRKSQQDVA